jgi:hypothetical protein
MPFDSLIHALLPKDEKFLRYFEGAIGNLLKTATVLREVMSVNSLPVGRASKIREVEELEHRGDDITHDIFSYLQSTFITPFDREDIHALASKLDDILDYMKGAATRMSLYKVELVRLIRSGSQGWFMMLSRDSTRRFWHSVI